MKRFDGKFFVHKMLFLLSLLFIEIACSISFDPSLEMLSGKDNTAQADASPAEFNPTSVSIPTTEKQIHPAYTPSFQGEYQHDLVDRYWQFVSFPPDMYTPVLTLINKQNQDIWYVKGIKGEKTFTSALLITRDAGHNWETHFKNSGVYDLYLDPANSNHVYLGFVDELWLSTDAGVTWNMLHNFQDELICQIYKSERDGRLFVATGWQDLDKVGIYISDDNGKSWTFHSFNPVHDNYLPWDISEHPKTGALYVVGEIADHPQPYQSVFYSSVDGGFTWEERFDLPWHATSVGFSPVVNDVYMLTEGVGLYRSTNNGKAFEWLSNYFWSSLKLDQNNQSIIYGGNHTYNHSSGGVFLSYDGGFTFKDIGLQGKIISSIDLNNDSSRIYVSAYKEGIFFADTEMIY